MKWRRIFVEALALIAISGVLALATNLLTPREKKLSWFRSLEVDGKNSTISGKSNREATGQAERRSTLRSLAPAKDPTLLYLEIQGDLARRLHDAGALFIDARREESYLAGHISNAINISVWGSRVDDGILGLRMEGVQFDDVIVVYCSGANCTDSLALSEKLAMAGYLNLYVYKNGFPEWKENGWPVASGKAP
jgi:rhodanese-related sulfurtransferase